MIILPDKKAIKQRILAITESEKYVQVVVTKVTKHVIIQRVITIKDKQ